MPLGRRISQGPTYHFLMLRTGRRAAHAGVCVCVCARTEVTLEQLQGCCLFRFLQASQRKKEISEMFSQNHAVLDQRHSYIRKLSHEFLYCYSTYRTEQNKLHSEIQRHISHQIYIITYIYCSIIQAHSLCFTWCVLLSARPALIVAGKGMACNNVWTERFNRALNVCGNILLDARLEACVDFTTVPHPPVWARLLRLICPITWRQRSSSAKALSGRCDHRERDELCRALSKPLGTVWAQGHTVIVTVGR